MSRVFCFSGQVSFSTFRPGYYSAFGKKFNHAYELKNEIRRLNGEEGKNVIEVGNELNALKKLKPPKFKPDIEGAMREMKRSKVNYG